MQQIKEHQLRAAACAHAQDRANREQATVFVYRGERDGQPCYYARVWREGVPENAELIGEVVPQH